MSILQVKLMVVSLVCSQNMLVKLSVTSNRFIRHFENSRLASPDPQVFRLAKCCIYRDIFASRQSLPFLPFAGGCRHCRLPVIIAAAFVFAVLPPNQDCV
jgi:hypothetical protein